MVRNSLRSVRHLKYLVVEWKCIQLLLYWKFKPYVSELECKVATLLILAHTLNLFDQEYSWVGDREARRSPLAKLFIIMIHHWAEGRDYIPSCWGGRMLVGLSYLRRINWKIFLQQQLPSSTESFSTPFDCLHWIWNWCHFLAFLFHLSSLAHTLQFRSSLSFLWSYPAGLYQPTNRQSGIL